MKVWIDYREPKARIEKYKEVLGDDAIIDDLGDNGGDWLFFREENDRCIEVRAECKSVEGLIADIGSGRAVDQIHGIIELADIPILVLCGYIGAGGPKDLLKTKLGTRNYSYFYLEHWLHSRENEGCRVYRFPRDGYEPFILKHMLAHYSDPDMNISAMKPRKHMLPLLEKDKRLEVLCGFKGLGLGRAKRLLDVYPNMIDIFNASPKELTQVEDMGPKSVETMFAQLGRPKNGKFVFEEEIPAPKKKKKANYKLMDQSTGNEFIWNGVSWVIETHGTNGEL